MVPFLIVLLYMFETLTVHASCAAARRADDAAEAWNKAHDETSHTIYIGTMAGTERFKEPNRPGLFCFQTKGEEKQNEYAHLPRNPWPGPRTLR